MERDGENLTVENVLVAGDGDRRRWWRWLTVLVGGGSSNSKHQSKNNSKTRSV